MMMRAEGDNNNDATNTISEPHKSCDRCGLKKRKCDGENPCRRCTRLGETCVYRKRRSRANRRQSPRPVSVRSASDPSVQTPSKLRAGRGVSAALQQHGRVSLKRCRLCPSPATGLVGMQENVFLSDYFGCVGFLRFTSPSNIRETIVNMLARSMSVQHSDSGDYSTTDPQHFDTVMPAESELPVGSSTCVFWCTVAIGALVKGRPIESVEKYSRLAREALANVKGPPNAELGRAWAILAYMSDFCGHRDSFHEFMKCADAILREVQEEENQTLPEGLSDVIKHGETIRIYVGDVNKEEVESFCNQERPNPQITQTATEDDICRFVIQSYRSFEQAVCQNVIEHRPTARSLGSDGEESPAHIAPTHPVANDFLRGSSPHFIASLIREQQACSGSSSILDMLITMLRNHSRRFEQIELAAGRSSFREGIGGLIVNGTLAIERVAKKDICGALGNLEACGEVFQRYPGICRFTMGAHNAHMLLANLVAIDGPRARAAYDKMRTAYNSAILPGTPAIPPFEQWRGVSACCDNYNCRLMDFMLNFERGGASSRPPPQELAAEIQEKGPRDGPVRDPQQRGVRSITTSREGTARSSVYDTRPTDKTIDASRLDVGRRECVSSDGRRTAMLQPQDPTCTTSSVFRGVVMSDVMVDSEGGRFGNGQSFSGGLTGLQAQAAEETLLLTELCRGRTGIGETEDDSIDVEDWLDVTHAMLDTCRPGLDLE